MEAPCEKSDPRRVRSVPPASGPEEGLTELSTGEGDDDPEPPELLEEDDDPEPEFPEGGDPAGVNCSELLQPDAIIDIPRVIIAIRLKTNILTPKNLLISNNSI
jgi:hypothetical protein